MDEFFYSIADLPLDEWNGTDGDNSILQNNFPLSPRSSAEAMRVLDAARSANPTLNYVPFKRPVKLNQVGYDSFAVKRALSKAGYGEWGKWGIKNLFGPWAVKNLEHFQKAKKLKVDGVYGLESHKKLAPYFDQYGIWLLHQVHLISPADKKRNIIEATAMVGYMNRYSIHYTQSSLRMQGVRNRIEPPHFPMWEDCSSFSTWCYWVSKASDPNGLNYDGQGYTGTLVNHGRKVYLSQAKIGDLIFYGWSGGIPTHVAVYIGNGRVVSHGSEAGPLLLPATYRPITTIRSYI
jgi:hypothetical protein